MTTIAEKLIISEARQFHGARHFC